MIAAQEEHYDTVIWIISQYSERELQDLITKFEKMIKLNPIIEKIIEHRKMVLKIEELNKTLISLEAKKESQIQFRLTPTTLKDFSQIFQGSSTGKHNYFTEQHLGIVVDYLRQEMFKTPQLADKFCDEAVKPNYEYKKAARGVIRLWVRLSPSDKSLIEKALSDDHIESCRNMFYEFSSCSPQEILEKWNANGGVKDRILKSLEMSHEESTIDLPL